ncbi:Sec20-domain-containing protein [Hymenopellis radicata]|nr:Sec20-domain-containing protein [Hymenopellis radicata]
MPPIPATFDEETSQIISAISRRQNDILQFQIPRLRECKGPLNLQQNLAGEVREDVDNTSRQIENLELLVGDQKGSKNRAELQHIVDEFKTILTNIKRDSRKALLESKRTIDSMSKSNREELLKSSAVTEKIDEKSPADALMQANNDVTEALRRTIGIMQGELERSVLSNQMLESSTASLRATSSTHDILTNVMGTSKQLITALEKADWLDRMLIMAALAFFFLVVLFVLKQRVVDRTMRVAFWWTRFVPDFGGDEVLLAMEDGLKAVTSISLASTVVVSVSSAMASSAATSSLVDDTTSTSISTTLTEILVPTDMPDGERTLIVDDGHDEL